MRKSALQRKLGYFLCIERGAYRIDLQVGKVYRTAQPEKSDPSDMLRLIDDSGEDYLYPVNWFVPVDLPPKAKKALVAASA
ncbi:MAG: hypothetical protein ABSB33_00720 [Tepidisphaeraceae bacterium]|jgi:hypothetical protein